jgi:hypothetical protein
MACANCNAAGHNRLTCPKPLRAPGDVLTRQRQLVRARAGRTVRRYLCSNCDGAGHNAQTCRAPVNR